MKKIDYISSKMIKRIKKMIENNEIDFRKREIIETINSSYDDVKKNRLQNIECYALAECEYLNKEYNESISSWILCIKYLIKAFMMENSIVTEPAIKKSLEESKKECGEVYIAYVLGKFEELNQYMSYKKIEDYFNNFNIHEDAYLKGMYDAIKEKNQKAFDELLEKRIRDIRKMPVDYLVIVDFWALSLIKYAMKEGMENNLKVIELGYTEQGNNVFI